MKSNIEMVLEGDFGFEITEAEIASARAIGARIHSFFRGDDEVATHYAAMPQVVEDYHRSGGTWAYSS